ncbi:hypothetical protein PanWU01x14_101230 [Parasponia andersonii]|uniref:Uncharacterized protein n=1 Tax=Parasponia andersonii TaxID=3476 RepID=A0A2P5D321_PARAD|nr:hypothetical protein PanWU01x14_101230 [Parasponia andersonii]
MQGGAVVSTAIVWSSQPPAKLPHTAYCARHLSLVTADLDIARKRSFLQWGVSIFGYNFDRFKLRS